MGGYLTNTIQSHFVGRGLFGRDVKGRENRGL